MKNKSIRDNIATLLIIAFNLILFSRHYIAKSIFEINLYSYIALIIGFILILFSIIFSSEKKLLYEPIGFFSILTFTGILSSLFTTNYEIQHYFIPFQYFGVGLALISFKLNSNWVKYFYYLVVLVFVFSIVNEVDPTVMFNISRNYVSIVIITTVLLYYISLFQNQQKITVYPSLISFLICVWAVGRGGIVTSALLLIGVNLYISLTSKITLKKLILKIMLIIIFIFIMRNMFFDIIFFDTISRFENQGMDSGGRDSIWIEYLLYTISNIYYLIFGVSFDNTIILKQVSGNPHNAFIQLHMRYGILGFIIVTIQFFYSFFKTFFEEKFLFIIFSVIFLRIFTDAGAFIGPFDQFIYYLMFRNKNKKNQISLLEERSE